MAVVTVTGGPFTDGEGNPLVGSWDLRPVPSVGALNDSAPLPAWGRLGDINAPAPGAFSALVPEGTYTFVLRMAIQVFYGQFNISYSNGATQTIEALFSAQG